MSRLRRALRALARRARRLPQDAAFRELCRRVAAARLTA
jgi:hypothetical protein